MPEEAVMDVEASPAEENYEAPAESTEVGEAEPEVDGETEGESEAQTEGEEDEEVEGQQEPVPADGRKMPDALKKGISSIKATNPEAAKQIKGLYYSDQEYRALFPKPEDAAAAKGFLEQVGGPEGLQQIQSERDEWGKLDQSFAEGAPEFIKTIAENNPEAFLKIAPQTLNEWAARAPEQYGYYSNAVALNTLAGAGITTRQLRAAHASYADNPAAQAVIGQIHDALLPLEHKKVQFEQKRMDPREEALKEKETQFEQRRRADFEGGVANQAETYLKDKMQPAMTQVIGARNVDPEAMKGFQSMIQREVERMLGEVPRFSENLEAHYRTGDSKKSIDYITAQYNRILPIAAKVIEPYLRNLPAAPAGSSTRKPGTPAAGRPASPGEVTLKEMPDRQDVDWSKTTTADMFQGKAVLTNGKKATW